ncbi:hypothetical protein H2248_009081 [Termitomyces sp. 'cryptogamus']|nr:hypothetical protein H2248_009081 [Termitomyces sp. 'cryptogamus']
MSNRTAGMVFQAMQTQLTMHMQAQEEGLSTVLVHMAHLKQTVQQLEQVVQGQEHEVYNGKSKQLADQFAEQVEAAVEFKVFRSNRQKIVWAQLYLTGLAHQWLSVITMGSEDPGANPRHFEWVAWLTDFRAAFCTRD